MADEDGVGDNLCMIEDLGGDLSSPASDDAGVPRQKTGVGIWLGVFGRCRELVPKGD